MPVGIEMDEQIKIWTAKQKIALVMKIIGRKGGGRSQSKERYELLREFGKSDRSFQCRITRVYINAQLLSIPAFISMLGLS